MSFYNNLALGFNNRLVSIRHNKFNDASANSLYGKANFGVAIKRDNGKEYRDWYMIPCGNNGWCDNLSNRCVENTCDCEVRNWKELEVTSYVPDTGTITFNLGDIFDELKKGKYIARVYLNCHIVGTFNIDWLPIGELHYVDTSSNPEDLSKPYPEEECDTDCCEEEVSSPCGEMEEVVLDDTYVAHVEWRKKKVMRPVKKGDLPLNLNFVKGK